MAKLILSTSHNTAVLRVRNMLIEQAGYSVITSKDGEVVRKLAREHQFDAAVLGDSIPVILREILARDLKQIKPELPLIIIFRPGEEDQLKGFASELVDTTHGAERLIEAISRVVGQPDE
jgi:DNA-binding response OmpR family regulator